MSEPPGDFQYEVPPGFFGNAPPEHEKPSVVWQSGRGSGGGKAGAGGADGIVYYSDKSKVVAGLLQIFFSFGVGRFYTGHSQIAVAQLLVCVFVGLFGSLLTCGMSLIVFFWPFIDGIIILASDSCDARGLRLR